MVLESVCMCRACFLTILVKQLMDLDVLLLDEVSMRTLAAKGERTTSRTHYNDAHMSC